MPDREIHIDFPSILKVAHQGAYRAAFFMGLGVNAASDPNFHRYELTNFADILLVPPGLPPEAVEQAKSDFRLWIEAAGLRELIESFGRFIDSIHWACLLVAHCQPRGEAHRVIALQNGFEKRGLAERLDRLEKYDVRSKNLSHLLALNSARNCQAHRLGQVDIQDVDQAGKLKVTWLGLQTFLKMPDGSEVVLNKGSAPIHCPDGALVGMKVVERSREFSLGEFIHFTTQELAEICWVLSQRSHQHF